MTRTSLSAVRRRLGAEGGMTLVELLVTLVILAIVLGGMTQLFVSATRAQTDLTDRFQAQQNARLALDALRREIHCANKITTDGTTLAQPTDFPRASIVISLGGFCPSAPAGGGTVTWCTQRIAADGTPSTSSTRNRWGLWRYSGTTPGTCGIDSGGVRKADYLTSTATVTDGNVFTAYPTPPTCQRAKLTVDLPVDVKPGVGGGLYELKDDIVLRNTARTGC